MPQPEYLDPTSYAADSSLSSLRSAAESAAPVGVLLIHGYTGSAAETRPMGEYLAARGFVVRCPLLAGHGTAPHELTRIRWQVWADQVESVFQELRRQCGPVFAGGLSMGSLLALWLGAQYPEIVGLIPMAPALQFKNPLASSTLLLRHLLKFNPFGPLGDDDLIDPEAIHRVWCYDELPLWGAGETYLLHRQVRQVLPQIHQPVLIFQGRHDAQLTSQAAQLLYDDVASADKTLVWLENSGHNLLVDGEREAVWAQSYEWMMQVAGGEQQAASEK